MQVEPAASSWRPSRRLIVAVCLCLALVGAAGTWLALGPSRHVPAATRPVAVMLGTAEQGLVRAADLGAPAGAVAPPAAAAPGSGAAVPAGQLAVPSLSITGAVYPVGVDKTNTMQVTENAFTVGWFDLGPLPGASGDAVETCHNQWYTSPRALCYNLHNVALGADIVTRNPDGTVHHWKVTRVTTVAYNASVPGLFDTTGPPRLSVITCGGQWLPKQQIFTQRVIVDAALADCV